MAIGWKLSTKLYDKRDDFNFPILNFPFLCGNIPASPAYGVFVSQLIRYARVRSPESDISLFLLLRLIAILIRFIELLCRFNELL